MEEKDDLDFLDAIIIIGGFAVIVQRLRSGSLDLWTCFGIFLFCIYITVRIEGYLLNRIHKQPRVRDLGEKSGFRRYFDVKILYWLVVTMFILLIFSISSNSKGTVLVALCFIGSFMLALVSLAKDRWLDSDLFRNEARMNKCMILSDFTTNDDRVL